jgi:preprotein translocase subunit YajC
MFGIKPMELLFIVVVVIFAVMVFALVRSARGR